MDNNFNNDNSFEPSRPFTEKPNDTYSAPDLYAESTVNEGENIAHTTENVKPQAFDQTGTFEPTKPFETDFAQNQPQQADYSSARQESYSQQTSDYSYTNQNSGAQQPQNYGQPGYGQPINQNGYGYSYQNNGYNGQNIPNQYNPNYNPLYQQRFNQPNPQQFSPQMQYPQYAQPQYRQPPYQRYMPQYRQPNYQQPQGFNQPLYQPYGQPQRRVDYSNTYAQPPRPAAPKKKLTPGVIVIIVVLSLLCVGGAIGIITYIAANAAGNSYDNSYSFTLPNGKYTTSAEDHPESDYSSKTNPSYEGIDLKAKPSDSGDAKYNTEYASSQVTDSIVGVLCYEDSNYDENFCNSQGSGIIITSDGYVVTNAHVINNSRTEYIIKIVTSDGAKHSAGVVGYDSQTDLALLKMDNAENLKAASFGNSKDISLGESVIVIGNPGGIKYNNSITKGIVSAVDRQISQTTNVSFIQTDAAINPGNSGGALVNMYGQVIGVPSSKIASTDYEGMGFAIPSSTVKDVIDSIMKRGYVDGRVKIGIVGENTYASGNTPAGILVVSIDEDGPCDNTELKQGDIIVGIDGTKTSNFAELFGVLESHSAGDSVELEYYRPSKNSTEKITITLQESVS